MRHMPLDMSPGYGQRLTVAGHVGQLNVVPVVAVADNATPVPLAISSSEGAGRR